MNKLERLQKDVADAEAAYVASDAYVADAEAAYVASDAYAAAYAHAAYAHAAYAAVYAHAAYVAWSKEKRELNEYLEEQQDND